MVTLMDSVAMVTLVDREDKASRLKLKLRLENDMFKRWLAFTQAHTHICAFVLSLAVNCVPVLLLGLQVHTDIALKHRPNLSQSQ